MGLLGDVSIPPAGKPVGWQAGPARSLPRCGLGGGLSICLSVSGGKLSSRQPPCLIGSSVPSQLDEEEERRKRRREKNKVAAARCRNKKKERTEFLQRVSRAGAGAGRPVRSSERAHALVGQETSPKPAESMWTCWRLSTWPPPLSSSLPPIQCPFPDPRQPRAAGLRSRPPRSPESQRRWEQPSPLYEVRPWC